MECQKCQQRPANVHITKYVNGIKYDMHLCEQCAQAAKVNLEIPQLPINNLKNLLGFLTQLNVEKKEDIEMVCPNCKTPFNKIHEKGFLGCSQCYEYFSPQIEQILRRVHGAKQHRGKVPARMGTAYRIQREIKDLRNELQEAVGREEYEKAAQIRDKIKSLEDRLA